MWQCNEESEKAQRFTAKTFPAALYTLQLRFPGSPHKTPPPSSPHPQAFIQSQLRGGERKK